MSQKLKELREKRSKLITDSRALLDRVEAEKRELSADEQNQWRTQLNEADTVRSQIELLERQVEEERSLAATHSQSNPGTPGAPEGSQRRAVPQDTEEYRSAFRSFLRTGLSALGDTDRRSLQAGIDAEGGALVAPTQFVSGIIQALNNNVFIRSLATIESIPTAASLGIISLDTDFNDAEWTSELSTGSDDDSLRFGRREMHPQALTKRVKVSNKLIRMRPDIENVVMDRLAYKFAVTQEKHFLLGNGASQPLGLFTPSNDGIPTSRDISSGNTSTAITFDGLISAKYAVKSAYWSKAVWMFHTNAVEQLVKAKDLQGQYIFRESTRSGEPDTVLGRPMHISEYVPNTFTTGQYVGLFGDLSFYYIADALSMTVQRLVELYAETNQTGFIGRLETDGQPVLAEAFSRVKLA